MKMEWLATLISCAALSFLLVVAFDTKEDFGIVFALMLASNALVEAISARKKAEEKQ